jgi:hypothetical protein
MWKSEKQFELVTTIPPLRRQRLEAHEFKASLGYIGKFCLKTHTHTKGCLWEV